MTVQEACAQAFENGRRSGDAEGYARGLRDAVKHGRWVYNPGNPYPYCSACGAEPEGKGKETNYCPNCGAKMDAAENK